MFTKELVIYFCTLIFVSNFSRERFEEYFAEAYIDIDFYSRICFDIDDYEYEEFASYVQEYYSVNKDNINLNSLIEYVLSKVRL